MAAIDWRELYASNRAVIERSGAAHPAPIIPAGPLLPPRSAGAWHERTFTAAGRIRRGWVHPPAGIEPDTAVPLVCLLHGCTQDAAAIAAATRMNEAADRHGFLAVYPEQSRGENPQGCWNWFLPQHQARGAGEPASITGLVRELIGTTSPWAIDPRRVFVAGFSAGGAMAAVLAATYPDLFCRLAVHSGLAHPSATNPPPPPLSGGPPAPWGPPPPPPTPPPAALKAMANGGDAGSPPPPAHARPVPPVVIHGPADTTVAPVNAQQVLQQSLSAHRLDIA